MNYRAVEKWSAIKLDRPVPWNSRNNEWSVSHKVEKTKKTGFYVHSILPSSSDSILPSSVHVSSLTSHVVSRSHVTRRQA